MKSKSKTIYLILSGYEVVEVMSFLLNRLKKDGLVGRKLRNKITMRFLQIVRERGVKSSYSIFTELSEFIDLITDGVVSVKVRK